MKARLASLRRRARLWPGSAFLTAPAETAALDDIRFVVLDLETTGLDVAVDEILAIGAVHMIGSRIQVGDTFDHLVRPAQPAWQSTVPVHRILPGDVTSAPDIETVLAEFWPFCAGQVLVGHMVQFDRTFLTRSGMPTRLQFENSLWLDTGRAARWLARRGKRWPWSRVSAETNRLSALARHYQIQVPLRHHALADAFVTAQVWQRQLTQLKTYGIRDLRDLARIGSV